MKRNLPIYLAMLAMVVTVGTIFFRLVEGWSWLDAYFFTVVTLSSVGYGSLVPATAIGKIGTTILIVFGIGIFAVIISDIGNAAVRHRIMQIERRRRARGKSETQKSAPPQGPDA